MLRGLLILALVAPALADVPWMDRRAVSRSGRHYAVLYRQGADGFRYELCARKPGAPALKPAAVPTRDVEEGRGVKKIARRAEDRVVASGELDNPPAVAWVVDRGPFVALLRSRIRRAATEPALRLVGHDGVAWTRTLEQLFGKPVQQFARVRRGGWHWFQAAWLTSDERGLCVLGKRDQLVRVDIATGAMGRADLLDGFDAATGDARLRVLEAAGRLRPKGMRDIAAKLAARPREPMAVRIRAAYAALVEGDAAAWKELFEAALADRDIDVRAYTLAHLPTALGEKAVGYWRRALKEIAGTRNAYRVSGAVTAGCRRLRPETVWRLAGDDDPALRAAARRALAE